MGSEGYMSSRWMRIFRRYDTLLSITPTLYLFLTSVSANFMFDNDSACRFFIPKKLAPLGNHVF